MVSNMKQDTFFKYFAFSIAALILLSSIAYFFFIVPSKNKEVFADNFQEKLKWQIERQWCWATISRLLDIIVTIFAWFSGLVLLALSGYQLKSRNEPHPRLSIWIAVFSALAVSFPALLNTFDFARQQTIYETAAREYDELYNQLVYGQSITIEKAVKKYNDIHRRTQYSLINRKLTNRKWLGLDSLEAYR